MRLAVVDDDHCAVRQIADALSLVLAFANNFQLKQLTGQQDDLEGFGDFVEVDVIDLLQLGNFREIVIVGEQLGVEVAREADKFGVHFLSCRAIIEEAAGVTMYKTKRRLAETKLEASKINLSRVNDILVEVEKQLASLKRQASKARRYAELREQMRGLLGAVLASKAEHLDIEAARLENLLREMDAAEERESRSVHDLEAQQERLNARTYELDAELRQTQNLLGQTALDLDRAENRITFNREQMAQLETRAMGLAAEIAEAERQAAELAARMAGQREAVASLRGQAAALEAILRETTEQASASAIGQEQLEARMEELRQLAGRLAEESVREHAESLQAEEAAARHTAAEESRAQAMHGVEAECQALDSAPRTRRNRVRGGGAARARFRRGGSRGAHAPGGFSPRAAGNGQQLERTREGLSGERARHASIEQILSERAYTADAVQKLFHAKRSANRCARGASAPSACWPTTPRCRKNTKPPIEQFLARGARIRGRRILRSSARRSRLAARRGGRPRHLLRRFRPNARQDGIEGGASMPGDFIARLDRLVEFREPLGPATKNFLKKLRTAYLVETSAIAERMAHDNPHSYFLVPDGTCYHGRTVSGGRKDEAGPLALKRELRQRETEVARLERIAQEKQARARPAGSGNRRERGADSRPRWPRMWKPRNRSLRQPICGSNGAANRSAPNSSGTRNAKKSPGSVPTPSRPARALTTPGVNMPKPCVRARLPRRRRPYRLRGWGICAAIFRRCKNRLSRAAKSWRLRPNGFERRSPRTRLTEEIAQASERVNALRQQHAALCGEKAGHRILLPAACAADARPAQG